VGRRTSTIPLRSSGSGRARSCVLRAESDVWRMLLRAVAISQGEGEECGRHAREMRGGAAVVVVQPPHDARRGDLEGHTM
jgi:hypothetical protein